QERGRGRSVGFTGATTHPVRARPGLNKCSNRTCEVEKFMNTRFSIAALKSRTALVIGLGAFLLTATLVLASRRAHESAAASNAAPASLQPLAIAGPGRVEPSSEDIKIGSELSGRLKVVNVEEGDAIHRGQVLAELENADYRAQVESARANVVAK